MGFFFNLQNRFFNAFRELVVHHHSSLSFRAKTFALVIAADHKASVENYILVKQYGLDVYKNDENRANLLALSTKELVQKVKDNNGLYLDTLVTNIQKELKNVPRYAHKIDIPALEKLIELSYDEDTITYQRSILRFLGELKEETLSPKKKGVNISK